MTQATTNKNVEWRTYKPNGNGSGSASKLSMRSVEQEVTKNNKTFTNRKVMLFWQTAQQNGIDENENAKFYWDDETHYVTIKLGEIDLGEMLACINGIKRIAGNDDPNAKYKGIFHKNDSGSSSFVFERTDTNFRVSVSKKVGALDPIRIGHTMTYGEIEILRLVLQQAVEYIYRWS